MAILIIESNTISSMLKMNSKAVEIAQNIAKYVVFADGEGNVEDTYSDVLALGVEMTNECLSLNLNSITSAEDNESNFYYFVDTEANVLNKIQQGLIPAKTKKATKATKSKVKPLDKSLPSSYYFLVDENSDIEETNFIITPIDYWNQNKYCYDQSISVWYSDFYKLLPTDYDDELMESCFGSPDDVATTEANMLKAGFIPAPQEMIDLINQNYAKSSCGGDCSNCTSCGNKPKEETEEEKSERQLKTKVDTMIVESIGDNKFLDFLRNFPD